MAAENNLIDLKGSPMAVNTHAVTCPLPAMGGRERKLAAGSSHLSGFLERGQTKNSSSSGSKVRRGSPVLSLLSADGRDPNTRRHLRATADVGARVPRSAEASLPHALLSMVW